MVFVNKNLCLAAVVSLLVGVTWLPQAEASRILDVQNFGAVGDGKTDNQAVLENVFALANRSPQTIVLFPPGSYLHSGRLSAGREIVVEGSQASLIGTNASAQSLSIVGDGTTVIGLTFQGQPGGDPAITFSNRTQTVIQQNIFLGFTDGIDCSNSQLVHIENNQFSPGSNGVGIAIESGSTIRISGNSFSGFQSPTSQTGVLCSANDIRIDKENTFNFLTVGVNATNSKSMVIDKNTFGNCQTVISSSGASNMTVSNNGCTSGNTFFDGLNVGTKALSVNNNTVSIFSAGFKNFNHNTNPEIDFNTFRSLGNVLTSASNTSLVLRANNLFSCGQGFNSQLDKKVTIDTNIFQTCVTPINLDIEKTVFVTGNAITTGDGIKVSNSTDVFVTTNRLTNIQNQGVLSTHNIGSVVIHKNVLNNCGLNPSINPPAVIYADGGVDLQIVKNTYTGNTQNLLYFIDTPVLGATVIGNTTNTMLPNKIGP